MSFPEKVRQEFIEMEFAYTEPTAGCLDPHITPDGDLRECRRPKKHADVHASGYGDQHVQWGKGR